MWTIWRLLQHLKWFHLCGNFLRFPCWQLLKKVTHIVYSAVYKSDSSPLISQRPVISFRRTGESVFRCLWKVNRGQQRSQSRWKEALATLPVPPQNAGGLKQSDCSGRERGRMHSEPAWTNHPFTHGQSMLFRWQEDGKHWQQQQKKSS